MRNHLTAAGFATIQHTRLDEPLGIHVFTGHAPK